MSKFLTLLLKLCLLFLLLALIGFGGYWLHVRYNWTYLMLGSAFAAFLVLCLLILFVRRLYYRKREEHFIRSMVDKDAPTMRLHEEQNQLEELRRQWARGLGILRRSRLRLFGNPIYSLPWFMVIGESGAGKSTAISHARLSAAGSTAGPLAHVPNTRNCDWWFFEEAVILDTAGRYALPVTPDSDEREWEELLDLIGAARKREPLNGLVLAIAAGRLLDERPEELRDYGRLIRIRLESVAARLGVRVPVYILVTKMDQVLGMTELAALLSTEEREQALGLLNREQNDSTLEFTEQALAHVQARLRDMGLLLAGREGGQSGRAALFSREFSLLAPGLRAFVQGAFAATPYSETPMLRGLFFSSGRQEGSTEARSLASLETFKDHPFVLPNTDSGLFLHSFFSTILPRERGFMQFLDSYLSRVAITRNLGYLVWLVFFTTLCGYFSVSFLQTRALLGEVRQAIIDSPQKEDGLHSTVVKLSSLADDIESFSEKARRNWWHFPGKPQLDYAIADLQAHYVNWIRQRLFSYEDHFVVQALAEQPPHSRRLTLAMLCEYMAWTHTVLNAIEAGREPPPPVADVTAEFFSQSGMSIPLNDAFLTRVFLAYAKWEDPEQRANMRQAGKQAIRRYMALLGDDLGWLTDWLESRNLLTPTPLSRYWSHADPDIEISRAFSKQGLERLEQMLAGLEEAAIDKADFTARARRYKAQYAADFRAAWWRMAERFHEGPMHFSTPEEWRAAATAMTRVNNPYFTFIRDMAENFTAVAGLGQPDERNSLPGLFAETIAAYSAGTRGADLETRLQQTAQQQKEAVAAALDADAARLADQKASASALFSKYMEGLSKTHEDSDTDSEAFIMASSGFDSEQASKTLVGEYLSTLAYLEAALDPKASANRIFWQLAEGPLAFQISLIVARSGCYLNELWQGNVLSFTRQYKPEHRWAALFEEKTGHAREFLDGPAKPFVRYANGQWMANEWLGIPFPAEPEFLSFLDVGNINYAPPADEYPVTLTALPVNVNDTAEKPYRVRLSLSCGKDVFQIDNYNYPVSKTFTWKPGGCGQTTLEIFFPSLALKKTWSDHWAFQSFLAAFDGGVLTLTPEDFPEYKSRLEELDVTEINVRYALDGVEDVLAVHGYPYIEHLPKNAAVCRTDVSVSTGGGMSVRTLPITPVLFKKEASLPRAPDSAGRTAAPPEPAGGTGGGRP